MVVREDAACMWCRTPRARAKKLVAGPGGSICDDCIRISMGLIQADAPSQDPLDILFSVVRAHLRNLPDSAPFATSTAMVRAAVALAQGDAAKCRGLVALVHKNSAAALLAYEAIPGARRTSTDFLNEAALASEGGDQARALACLALLEGMDLPPDERVARDLHRILFTLRDEATPADTGLLEARIASAHRALSQLEDGDISDAFRAALAQEARSAAMLCALRAGDDVEAARLAREHHGMYPSEVESLVVLAVAHERLGQSSEASSVWAQVRAKAHPDGWYARRVPGPFGGPYR
jgi:hypothetical protein